MPSKIILDKKIKDYIHMAIQEELLDFFGDPDEGLELKESFKKELRKAQAESSISLTEMKRRLKSKRK